MRIPSIFKNMLQVFLICELIISLIIITPAKALKANQDAVVQWFALSNAAAGITGDIKLSSTKIMFSQGGGFVLKNRDDLLVSSPDFNQNDNPSGTVSDMHLYKIVSSFKMLAPNVRTICGIESPRWIETFIAKGSDIIAGDLELSFFWGRDLPPLESSDSVTTNNLCGTMFYTKS